MRKFFESLIKSTIVVIFFVIFSKVFPFPKLYHYFLLLILLTIFYYLVIPVWAKLKSLITRKFRLFYPKIGILDGCIRTPLKEYKCKRVWAEVTPSMWYNKLDNLLNKMRLKKITLVAVSEIDDSFSIIINPFGDNFPEEDTRLHRTFYNICNYIKRGGIFVNPGGAFFWHQNTTKSDKPEQFMVKSVDGIQSLKDSPLYNEFGVSTTGDMFNTHKQLVSKEPLDIEVYQDEAEKQIIGDILKDVSKIKRFRAVKPETTDYIPFVREKDNNSFPVAGVRYGDGYLILAGMHLSNEHLPEFKILTEAVKNLALKRFKNLLR